MYYLKHLKLQHLIDKFNKMSEVYQYRFNVHRIDNVSELYVTLEIVDYETNHIQRETHTIHEWLLPHYFDDFVNNSIYNMKSIKE